MASVHSRMYIPLVHSTSAVSHSVFICLRVRFDSSRVAYVVHNCSRLYRRRRAETTSIRHACAFRDNVDQRGAASRRIPEKKFSDPLLQKVEKGGPPGGYGAYAGKTSFRKSRRQLHPVVSDLRTSRIRARSASPPPKKTARPHACTSDATEAIDAHGGHARGRAHEELRDAAQILQPPSLSEIAAMTGGGGGAPSISSASAHAARSRLLARAR